MLSALTWMNALDRVMAKIGRGVRECIVVAAIGACAGVVFLVAGGFAIAAGYIALSRELPPHLAALGIAAALALFGALLLIVAAARGRGRRAHASGSPQGDLSGQAEKLADLMVKELITRIQQKPSSAVVTAVVMGVVVGLLRRNRPS